MTDHILQTRPKDVPGGILLTPCPPGVSGGYKVIWRGETIYSKTPEEWKFPEHSEIDRLIDEMG